MKVYLDACCLSRLTDDQSQARIRQETEAVEAETLLSLASATVEVDDAIAQRAREFVAGGYGLFDALQLAAAESVDADVLLSTDDRFIKRAGRGLGNPRIPARNPGSWIQQQEP